MAEDVHVFPLIDKPERRRRGDVFGRAGWAFAAIAWENRPVKPDSIYQHDSSSADDYMEIGGDCLR